MGRTPGKIAGRIYRNCDAIAEHHNEIRRLRRENERLEHLDYQAKTGKVVSLEAYRNEIRFPRRIDKAA